MDDSKPTDEREYLRWLKREHHVEATPALKQHYEAVARKVRDEVVASSYWNDLASRLQEWNDEYLATYKYPLLSRVHPPKLVIKTFGSFLDKTYRKNVVLNEAWPDPPSGGWWLPDDWFSRINDMVRTRIVVRYLDGVRFICDRLNQLADENGIPAKTSWEAKEEGYYAAHFYIKPDFEVPTLTWMTKTMSISAEIQVTTEIQEVVTVLLHKYYDEKRASVTVAPQKWQWDYKSEEFIANYLGHIVHYVEGMVMDIRDRQEGAV